MYFRILQHSRVTCFVYESIVHLSGSDYPDTPNIPLSLLRTTGLPCASTSYAALDPLLTPSR